jgi:hypothetical protein
MRKNGWQVAGVEKYLKAPGMKFGRRIDVWGFGDLLACRPEIVRTGAVTPNHKTKVISKAAIALIQCCADDNGGSFAAHRAKILNTPLDSWTDEQREESKRIFAQFKIWKESGGRVFLQGWGYKGKRGEKQWTLREEVL